MNFKRIGRVAICLLLVCVLLINISPIRAEASAVGAVEVVKAAAVSGNPYLICGALLIAIGVCAGVNSDAFQTLTNNAVSYLESVGGWIQDGTMNLIQTVDSVGNTVYYAGVDLFETLRGWLFDSGIVSKNYFVCEANSSFTFASGTTIVPICNYITICASWYDSNYKQNYKYEFALFTDGRYFYNSAGSKKSGSVCSANGVTYYYTWADASSYPIASYDLGTIDSSDFTSDHAAAASCLFSLFSSGLLDDFVSGYDISLGEICSVPIDGTSAKEWASTYADLGLYVIQGGGSGQDPDDGAEGNDNWKWFLPLSLTLTIADLWAMSQADQWTGTTPSEFDDYTTSEEYDVTAQPDIDGYPAIEITPVADPDTGGDTGGNTGADVDTDYTTWFQKVVDWLEGIWEAITNIPDAIVNGIKTILQELFVPDPDFIPNKVEALQAQYKFLEPMQQTGEDLKLFFQNIGSQPPIIWIDLGAGTGWYPMGGKVKFIDLTWYSQYKPTADFIVGGSIWLWLAWRMFKAIPGIISGDSGSVGAPTVAPDISFNTARLTSGRSRRKKDGE